MITVLERYHRFFGDEFTIEYPTGSGRQLTLDKVADLHDNLIFSEYFHGDNGAAIGAFHQTGWTGLIADVVRRRHGEVRSVGDIVRLVGQRARP
jgi:hypothetical protein